MNTYPSGAISVDVGDDFVATVELRRLPENYFDLVMTAALADYFDAGTNIVQ